MTLSSLHPTHFSLSHGAVSPTTRRDWCGTHHMVGLVQHPLHDGTSAAPTTWWDWCSITTWWDWCSTHYTTGLVQQPLHDTQDWCSTHYMTHRTGAEPTLYKHDLFIRASYTLHSLILYNTVRRGLFVVSFRVRNSLQFTCV